MGTHGPGLSKSSVGRKAMLEIQLLWRAYVARAIKQKMSGIFLQNYNSKFIL